MRLVDAEAMVVTFLKANTSTINVGTKVPATRPARFIRAFRTGGAAENRVLERVQITVQAWDSSSIGAFDLVSECREALFNLYTYMPLVRGVNEIGGLRFDPDPDSKSDRYTFTVELMVRAKR